jgi:hypothetical protein
MLDYEVAKRLKALDGVPCRPQGKMGNMPSKWIRVFVAPNCLSKLNCNQLVSSSMPIVLEVVCSSSHQQPAF